MFSIFSTTVATPRKCPGRQRPSSGSATAPTSTHVAWPAPIDLGVVRGRARSPSRKRPVFPDRPASVRGYLARSSSRSELARIDVNPDDRHVALGLRRPHEAQVSLMQRPHRRHQADPLSRAAVGQQRGADFSDGGEDAGRHGVFSTFGGQYAVLSTQYSVPRVLSHRFHRGGQFYDSGLAGPRGQFAERVLQRQRFGLPTFYWFVRDS